ncbi:ABC transporter ATP-binding protein [Brevibacillus sp. H7]|uniref:ABC transporter ATP-binding protein n=1 Tax=Brevibacillus sp. H7 TaxID=3349138 RepID=UPI00381088A5
MPPILQIEQLSKTVESAPLFSQVTAEVDTSSIIHILGKSGQGKSTLLRILGLLTKPDTGTIRLHGIPSSKWEPEQWRSKVSYVAQHAIMLPGSVEDNLRAVSRLHAKPFDQAHALSLMERLGLADIDWSKPAAQLSGGQKQRLALIRTLLLRPEVLLLDEVTASLDTVSKQAVERMLSELHYADGTTLIWVTHDLQQARNLGQRIWFLADHRLLEDTDAASFFTNPATEAAKQFLHSVSDSLNGKEGK